MWTLIGAHALRLMLHNPLAPRSPLPRVLDRLVALGVVGVLLLSLGVALKDRDAAEDACTLPGACGPAEREGPKDGPGKPLHPSKSEGRREGEEKREKEREEERKGRDEDRDEKKRDEKEKKERKKRGKRD